MLIKISRTENKIKIGYKQQSKEELLLMKSKNSEIYIQNHANIIYNVIEKIIIIQMKNTKKKLDTKNEKFSIKIDVKIR